MRICFDLTSLYDHLTGIERYAMNIAYNIVIHHPENEYILLFKNEIHPKFRGLSKNVKAIVISGKNKLFFAQISVFRVLREVKADAFVFLAFTSPLLFRNKNIISAIHDLTPWDCPESMKRILVLYGKIVISNAIKVSKKILTVSEFSKERICTVFGVPEDKIKITYNGVSEQFEKKIDKPSKNVSEKYNIPKEYILCLSTLEPRKNIRLLLRAYSNLYSNNDVDIDLVLVGRKGWKLKYVFDHESSIDSHIHITGFVNDEDLPSIYKSARVFVLPSTYEGFGIPVIEAMSQGTLVVCSNSSSLPEVSGEAGILFQNNNQKDLEEKIKYVLNLSDDEIDRIKNECIMQADKFKWCNEAEKAYKIILQSKYSLKEEI